MHRSTLIMTGIAAGALLAVTAPLAASAHVHIDPSTVAAGATETLSFAFSHGCDDSPTTALTISIPDAVANATPIVQGGWSITRELGPDGIPTSITYTAAEPVDSALKASVSMDVLIATSAADSTLAFPVTQQCATGAIEWSEVAAEGVDPATLETPAPLVQVGAGAPAEGAHGAHDDPAATDDVADDAAEPVADPVARGIAGAALGVAVVALLVALIRRRRS